MTKGDLAKKIFESGANCSQAVVLAFQKELGISEEDLKKLVIGLGGGVGRLRHTCGAVTGMAVVLGKLLSDGENKLAIYEIVQKACADFKKELGTLICAELLDGATYDNSPNPEQRTQKYYEKRPCAEICKIAGDIAEKYINN